MKPYYDVPTQIEFVDYENEEKLGGIAYHDIVICGCCGGVIPIEEMNDGNYGFEFQRELEWTNVSDEILGGI